jgi:Tol biopolymer transport system component/DNA-binding winged helix-turn-helix (wHTH) protein
VDPVAFRVTKAGRPVPLEPKAFEVLLVLLERPGRLVEKRELLERVWPDAVVTESAMTRVIADLRRALGDAVREGRYIETVPTKGYRFVAEVRRPEGPPPPAPAAAPLRRSPTAAWFAAGLAALALLGVLAVGVRRPRSVPAPAPVPAKLVQLTDSLGLDAFPTFSPDGAQIAFCSDREGTFEIYVRQLAPGGRDIRITSDGRDNVQPVWSPDGSQIAYASRGLPGIWLVAALGGDPRRLTTFGSRPAWSPDGKTIAFQSSPVAELSATAPAAAPPSVLWVVPAAGGEPTALTRSGAPRGGHGAPVFSSDGSEVIFVAWLGRSEMWSVSRKDLSTRRILPRGDGAAGPNQFYDPVLSPADGTLYYAASDRYLNASLWRSRPPAAPGGSWGAPERVTPDATSAVRHIAVSRSGKIAYAALSITSNLWSLPLDPATFLPAAPPTPLTHGTGCRAMMPRFSPDGRRIAFISCRVGSSTDVWIVDAGGGEARPVTLGPGAGLPDWFPDGERIAFFTRREGKPGIWAINLQDHAQRLLFALEDGMWPTRLSPDGKLLAYTRETPAEGLATFVAPLEGGPPRRLTPPDVNASYPCWSPDGRTIALQLARGPDWQLATVPATGGNPVVLVPDQGMSWPSGWSPDGERICFAGFRDGIWDLYWVARSGGPSRRLTNNATRRAFLREPAWSPKGDQIVYERSATIGNVWLLDLAR